MIQTGGDEKAGLIMFALLPFRQIRNRRGFTVLAAFDPGDGAFHAGYCRMLINQPSQ